MTGARRKRLEILATPGVAIIRARLDQQLLVSLSFLIVEPEGTRRF
jgi:hypothetical protein